MTFAQSRFELLEFDKKLADSFRWNADAGILDFDTEKSSESSAMARIEIVPPSAREFDGIGKIVVENLLEPCRVDDDVLDVAGEIFKSIDWRRPATRL